MATAEYVLQTLSVVEQHIKLLTAASRPDEIVRAASGYLESWSRERIENLQKSDGGWGTFDSQQRPKPIRGVADFARISDALSNHCRALRNAGIELTAEILELDLYFALAKQVGEDFITFKPCSNTVTSRSPGYRRWSDKDAKAA